MIGNVLTGKGVTRAVKHVRAGRGYNNMDHMDKIVKFHFIL